MNEVVRRKQMKALFRRFYTWLRHANAPTATPINTNNNSDSSNSSICDVYNQSLPSFNPSSPPTASASKVDTAGATSLLPTTRPSPSGGETHDKSLSSTATVGYDKEKEALVELLRSYLENKSTSSTANNSDKNYYNTGIRSTTPINNSINTSAPPPTSTPLRIMTPQDAYTIIQYELRLLSQQCETLEERNKVLLGQLGDRQMADKVLEQVYAYLTRETSRS